MNHLEGDLFVYNSIDLNFKNGVLTKGVIVDNITAGARKKEYL